MNRFGGKLGLKFLLAGVLAAATIWGAVSHAQSSTVVKGQFTLPFEAQWGKLNLQPGSYTFSVKAENSSYIVSVRQGQRSLGFVLASDFASPVAQQQQQDHALLCVRHSGECSVGALKMPEGVFYFSLPGSKTQVAQQQPDLIERVPVLFAQN
jgi:hypothetical protein